MNKNMRLTVSFLVIFVIAFFSTSLLSSFTAAASSPTATPKPKSVFSPKTYNKKKPSGIMAILMWFLGGGGGPLMWCDGDQPNIQFEMMDRYGYYDHYELMDNVTILGCNWRAGENLELTIKYPNGRKFSQTFEALALGENWGGIYLDFRPALNEPAGVYQVTIKGETKTVKKSITFNKPSGRDVFLLDNKSLLLQGFPPYETVQVASYDEDGKFKGWNEYKVASDGSLQLQVSLPVDTKLLVNSPSSGINLVMVIPASGTNKAVEICPLLESRLERNKWVAAVGDVSYYTFMDRNSKVIKKMQNQSRHFTIGGPWCVEGKLWWKLQSKKNFSGYVIEVDAENYHLRLIE